MFEDYFAGLAGEKMWQRSDWAILWLRSKLIVRLELPARTRIRSQTQSGKGTKSPRIRSAVLNRE
jgi:hypothetical protein